MAGRGGVAARKAAAQAAAPRQRAAFRAALPPNRHTVGNRYFFFFALPDFFALFFGLFFAIFFIGFFFFAAAFFAGFFFATTRRAAFFFAGFAAFFTGFFAAAFGFGTAFGFGAAFFFGAPMPASEPISESSSPSDATGVELHAGGDHSRSGVMSDPGISHPPPVTSSGNIASSGKNLKVGYRVRSDDLIHCAMPNSSQGDLAEQLDRLPPRPFLAEMPQLRHRVQAAAAGFAAALLWCAPEAAQAQRRCRVADVVVSPSETTVRSGENYPFTATAYDAAGNPCDNISFSWSSTNPAYATIDANGIAHGVSAGTAAINARTGSGPTLRTGTGTLLVTAGSSTQAAPGGDAPLAVPGYAPVLGRPMGLGYAAFDRQPEGTGPADGLLVEPLTLTMVRGEWRALDFRAVRGTDGQIAARVPIVFLVEPGGERTVSVDSLGVVTSLGDAGTATVRLTVPGQARIAPKQVRVEVRADSLRFNRTDFSLTPGATETLSVFIPAQARALNNPSMFQFRSTDPAKVRVNPVNPIIEALAPGTARVIAQSSIYPEVAATVHVHQRVASLRLTPADSVRTIAIGGRTTVRAAAAGENGAPVPEAPISWRSPDTSIVAFDSATGTVRGLRSGIATISVSVPTVREEAITRMVRVRVVAGGLSVARARFGMGTLERQPLEVALLDDSRTSVGAANSYLTWTVAPDSVLRVEQGNEIVALKPGRARLTGRAPWDSTITLDVFVVGDMIVTAQNQGHRDLVMKWNGGQNGTPLTNDSTVELQSAWSPDFTRVAYTVRGTVPPGSRVQPGSALFLMQADGSSRVRVTDDSVTIRFPSFTPAGDKLVFESNRSGRAQVWVGDLRGDSLVQLRIVTGATPTTANTAPAVSHDGQHVAYVSLRETGPGRPVYGIYQAAIDGSDERLRTAAPSGQRIDSPVYAPDGRTLYFLRSESGRPPAQRVYRITVDGADSAVAVTPPILFVTSFAVSADGATLALATLEQVPGNNQQPLQHVMLFNVATGQAQAIDTAPDERPASPTLRPARPAPAASPGR